MNSYANESFNRDHATTRTAQPEAPVPRATLFVYGTLKRGFPNHRFCLQATSILSATVVGRLYLLPAGYPALEIPGEDIFAHGTTDLLADAMAQARLAASLERRAESRHPKGDWDLVHGELVTLPDPVRTLPPIDRLEGFHPGQLSYYQRVLVPAWAGGQFHCAWTYVMDGHPGWRRLQEGCWPPSSLEG